MLGFRNGGVRAENHVAEPKGRRLSYCAKVGYGMTVDDDRALMTGGEQKTTCDGSNAIPEEMKSKRGVCLSAIGRERKTMPPSPKGKA